MYRSEEGGTGMGGTGKEDERLDRLRAATRLIDNHEAVVRFAARGCGTEGNPPVMAPLSDPNAQPGLQYVPAVDAGTPPPPHRQTSNTFLQ